MFSLSIDSNCATLLHAHVWGLWSLDDAQRFGRDADALIATMPVPPGRHLTCFDMSAFKIQPQIVVRACLDMVVGGITGERSAFIVGDGLARIQIKRVTANANIQVFDDAASARQWLLGIRKAA